MRAPVASYTLILPVTSTLEPSTGLNNNFLAFPANIIAFILLFSSLIEKYKCPVEGCEYND